MAWAGQRATRLSGSAQQARARRVLERHGTVCHLCGHPGADVADHVVALSAGGPDTEANLRPAHQAPCPTCHRRCHQAKTQREARAGRYDRAPRKRAPERHPGFLPPHC